jgi:hypothetical protein
MRRALLLPLVVGCVACGSSSAPSPRTPSDDTAPVLANTSRYTCAHAGRGLEGATRGVRDPDQQVFDALVARCAEGWPTEAVECFALMREGDLGRCSTKLAEPQRDALFAVLAGGEPSQAGLAVARARLEQLAVGIETCDRFVSAVTALLGCDALSIDMRLQLGNDTAQFWSLPTDRLGTDDRQRMSQVCVTSLETLTRETGTVGCAL